MKPYYDHDGITIYHGDCREILPTLGGVKTIIADPPYGINHPTAYKSRGRGKLAQAYDYPPLFGDGKPFDPSHMLGYKNVVLWGANHYARVGDLPDVSGWLVWDKLRRGLDMADAELAWTNCIKGVRVMTHLWNGMMVASEHGERYHPTQKPVELMGWCINLIKEPGLISDPYMGSGPTLVAAKALRYQAIGIEIEEKYCEIAAKRLSQEVFKF